jgi:hypothetical protein
MRPNLTTPFGDFQTKNLPTTDQTGPWMGPPEGLRPLLDNRCAPVIPPSEFGDIWLKLSALVCFVLGREGFFRSVSVSSLEPSLYFPKCCALPGFLLCTRRFIRQKLMSDSSKEAPWLPLNWVGRKWQDLAWSHPTIQNYL